LIQTRGAVDAWTGNGDPVPGWPARWADPDDYQYADPGNSAPVVGDVDGDRRPDVVFTSRSGRSNSRLYLLSRDGVLLKGFPKEIRGCDARAPAIADIDLDGRNQILIGSAAWDDVGGMMDSLWVYDLGGPAHGRIEWGQVGGDARHRYVYPVPPP